MKPRAIVFSEKIDLKGPRVWAVLVTEINTIKVMSTEESAQTWANNFNRKGHKG